MISLVLSITTLILVFLEVTYPHSLSLFGVKPDLLLILIIFLSLYSRGKRIFFWAVLLGGLKDLLSADLFGINILSLSILSMAMSVFEARFFLREKFSSLFVFVFSVSCLNAIIVHILHLFFTSRGDSAIFILKICFFEGLATAIWSVPLVYGLRKCALKFFVSLI